MFTTSIISFDIGILALLFDLQQPISQVGKKGKDVLKTGLFAVKGRTYDKIIAKQKNLIENLEEKLEEEKSGKKGVKKPMVAPEKKIDPANAATKPINTKNMSKKQQQEGRKNM